MMKIVAGLGSIDEYIPYVQAGADEFFCGYVPANWTEKYGTLQALNRREVMNVNVQLGAMEDLKILKNMMDCYGVPVKLTFNSLFYSNEQYKEVAEIIERCMNVGFSTFIIADPALIVYVRQQGIRNCRIHLSGEMSEINSLFLKNIAQFDIERVIFHRKNTISEMKSCIAQCKNQIPEYEAFMLNELCHFTGAYCNSLHCDELCHLCHVPYELGTYDETEQKTEGKLVVAEETFLEDAEIYVTGATGCGLCSLYQLEQAGVTHLKIVGRGNYVDCERQDIAQLKKALNILEEIKENRENQSCISQMPCSDRGYERDECNSMRFKERIQEELFHGKCSKNCYY